MNTRSTERTIVYASPEGPQAYFSNQLLHFFTLAITSAVIFSGGAATALLSIFGEALTASEPRDGLVLVRVALSAFLFGIVLSIACCAFSIFAVDAWSEGVTWNAETRQHETSEAVHLRGYGFRRWAWRFGILALISIIVGSASVLAAISGFRF